MPRALDLLPCPFCGCVEIHARTRRSELTEQGLIVDTGRRKTHLPSPRKHIVWAIKSALDVKY